tara:strand:- start:233 stop:637 length:405 start_codon:yes stop_codon:yes gene_type:complete
MENKKCPVCKEIKSIDFFYSYLCKKRNTNRYSNYCRPCARINSNVRAKKHYQDNKEQKLRYRKEYSKNNPEKIKKLSAKFSKKYREELKECYVAQFAAKSLKCSTKEIHENPELLKAYKNNMNLKRKFRNYGTK